MPPYQTSHYCMPNNVATLIYNLGDDTIPVNPGKQILQIGMDTELELQVEYAPVSDQDVQRYVISLHSIKPRESDFTAKNVHLCVEAPHRRPSERGYKAKRCGEKRLVTAVIEGKESIQSISQSQIWAFSYALFTLWPDQDYIALWPTASVAWQSWLLPLLRSGLAVLALPNGYPVPLNRYKEAVFISREEFWQGTGPLVAGGWIPVLSDSLLDESAHLEEILEDTLSLTQSIFANLIYKIISLGRTDPLYRRYIPELSRVLTFHTLNPKCDKDIAFCEEFDDDGMMSMYDFEGELTEDRPEFACAWNGQLFGIVDFDQHQDTIGNETEFGSGAEFKLFVSKMSSLSDYERLVWIRSVIHVCDSSLTDFSSCSCAYRVRNI